MFPIDRGSNGCSPILTVQALVLNGLVNDLPSCRRQVLTSDCPASFNTLVAERTDTSEAFMTSSYAVVLTTAKSLEDARDLAEKVLREKLAACVQLLPISSLYTWKDAVAEESEVLLLLKTREELYSELEKAILSVHKYETQEILQLQVAQGLPAYLGWIDDVT